MRAFVMVSALRAPRAWQAVIVLQALRGKESWRGKNRERDFLAKPGRAQRDRSHGHTRGGARVRDGARVCGGKRVASGDRVLVMVRALAWW
jgi:hypothetical protein